MGCDKAGWAKLGWAGVSWAGLGWAGEVQKGGARWVGVGLGVEVIGCSASELTWLALGERRREEGRGRQGGRCWEGKWAARRDGRERKLVDEWVDVVG